MKPEAAWIPKLTKYQREVFASNARRVFFPCTRYSGGHLEMKTLVGSAMRQGGRPLLTACYPPVTPAELAVKLDWQGYGCKRRGNVIRGAVAGCKWAIKLMNPKTHV